MKSLAVLLVVLGSTLTAPQYNNYMYSSYPEPAKPYYSNYITPKYYALQQFGNYGPAPRFYPAASVASYPSAALKKIDAGPNSSASAAAALAYMKNSNNQDICSKIGLSFLQEIVNGGTTQSATAVAETLYRSEYNKGSRPTPGSPCQLAEDAWKTAVSKGKNPVLDATIAFMDNWQGIKEGNPCAVSGRAFVTEVLKGSSEADARISAAKGFSGALKQLSAEGKELRDPACAAATKAFYQALPTKPSVANGNAMIKFVEQAFSGSSFEYDPVCWKAAEAFIDSFAAGNTDSTSNLAAAEAVFTELTTNGASGIPADSPCVAAANAYYTSLPNQASSSNTRAFEAAIQSMISQGRVVPDPVCISAARAFWQAYNTGSTESDATLAAAEEFVTRFSAGDQIPASSPCLAATKAYAKEQSHLQSQGNAVAMLAFIDTLEKDNSQASDIACASASQAFFQTYRAGKNELEATTNAALAFIETVKAGAQISPRSPCMAAAQAYSSSNKRVPSTSNSAAMLAFLQEAATTGEAIDSVCLVSAEAFLRATLAGATEEKAGDLAGIAYLDAVATTPNFSPNSPCGKAARAYMNDFQ